MTEPTSPQGADVHVPPPLVYAVPLVAAWAVDRVLPWRMPGSGGARARYRAGGGRSGDRHGGRVSFRRHHTSIIPGRPASAIVTTGPYMYTRNPMYLGMTVAYVGGSLVLGTWWAPVALPAVVAFVDRNVIRREEAYLRSRFGDDYEEFSAHTRRWL